MTADEMVAELRHHYAEVLAGQWDTPGLRITIGPALSWEANSPIKWSLAIERERVNASGKAMKPTKVVNIVNNEGETPADMLRVLASMLEPDGRPGPEE